jgi:hypothetical protein
MLNMVGGRFFPADKTVQLRIFWQLQSSKKHPAGKIILDGYGKIASAFKFFALSRKPSDGIVVFA